MQTEAHIKELGINLPALPSPGGNYVHAVRTGNLLYLSGKGPFNEDGSRPKTGKVGKDVTTQEAYQQARSVGLTLITVMKDALGDLDKVKRVVKVLGMVNCAPDFGEQPQVINGCSDVFVEVFGDRGRHARSAVGMGGLPGQICVEIEVIVEVE
ncbi:MAG TPA: RidA family protein [Nitrolancea sp.]|nr:RidA family protein [Nitrolancea sp.]